MYESIIQKVREVPKQLQDEAFEQYLLEKINKLKEYEQNKLIEGTIFDNKNTKHFFLQQAFGGGASPYDILYPGMTFEVMEIRDSSGSGNIPCQVCNKLAFVRLFYQNPQNAPYLDFTKIIKIKSAIIKIYLSKWSHENTGWVDYKLLHFQPTDHKRELFKIGPKQIEKKAHEIFASRHTYAQKKQAVETYLNQYPNDTYTDEARAKITDIQNQIDDDAFSHALQNSDDRSKIQKLENYLQIFPDGRHVDEAKNEIEKIRQKWSKEKEKIKQQRDDGFFKRALIEPDDLHRKNRLADYLSRFPNGSHIVEANKKIEEINVKLDDKAFNKAFHNKSDRSRLSALEKYMQVHPNGRYVAKASMEISRIKSKMDDDAFAKAMRTRPKSRFKALEKYLDRFPDGIHREEANKQLGQN
jgi:hypothetical protein